MKAIDYKGKHFILTDENFIDELDQENEFVDVEKITSDDDTLTSHIAACRYYGIPPYLGSDEDLKDRIMKIEKELDVYG